MNPNHDQELEEAIRRELRALPELSAPDSLAQSVMATIERRANVPWYRRSWANWPISFQVVSLAAMLLLFAGLFVAGRDLLQTQPALHVAHQAGKWFSGLNTIGSMLNILGESAILAAKQLGLAVVIFGLAAAALAYAIFLGLGTVYVRLAFSKS